MHCSVSADSRHEVQTDIWEWIDSLRPRSRARETNVTSSEAENEAGPVIDTGATTRGQSHASKNGAIDSPAL